MNQLDAVFHAKRLELIDRVVAAGSTLWTARTYGDRGSFVDQAVRLVTGGQSLMVSLVSAYFDLQVQLASGADYRKGENPPVDLDYESMRGVPAKEVYDRPFGTLGYQLSEGFDFEAADEAARKYVEKLVSVDMQLAGTHASRAWIEAYNASA